jgi:hypothetical protein
MRFGTSASLPARTVSQEPVIPEDHGSAQSTSVLYEVLLLTATIAMSHVNFESGHVPIHEGLENFGCELPLSLDYTQPRVDDGGGVDSRDVPQCASVTVELGQFEVTTEKRYLDNLGAWPERAVRLRKDVADAHGFCWREDGWTFEGPAESIAMSNGDVKHFPEGRIVLKAEYDLEFPWPQCNWPEGSL